MIKSELHRVFCLRLKSLRIEKRIMQTKLAKQRGVNPSQVSQFESRRKS